MIRWMIKCIEADSFRCPPVGFSVRRSIVFFLIVSAVTGMSNGGAPSAMERLTVPICAGPCFPDAA